MAAAAEFVAIDEGRVATYAVEVATVPPPATDDPARRAHGDAEATAAFVLALDAANFGSGWFPSLRKAEGQAGYYVVARAIESAVPITASWLAAVDPTDMARRLGQERNDAAAPFVREVTGALADLGRLLLDTYDGSAAAFVEAAEHSAARLVAQLWAMPRYRDVAVHHGEPVWFLKRAQLTVSDLSHALADHPLGTFADLDQLTVFADNLLPHVLRTDGVLLYRPELAARVDRRHELDPGRAYEVELRAATVTAAEQLRHALGTHLDRRVTAAELDWWLWSRGQGERYRHSPRHRTRTVFY